MKSRKLFIAIIALASITISSCSNDSEDDLIDVPNDPNGELVTYTNKVKAIIDGSCLNCHSSPPTNGAPFALTNFAQVSSRAAAILNAMERANGSGGAMPPAGRLPQSTINTIDQWIKDGTLE